MRYMCRSSVLNPVVHPRRLVAQFRYIAGTSYSRLCGVTSALLAAPHAGLRLMLRSWRVCLQDER
jgi:hypothetical protein